MPSLGVRADLAEVSPYLSPQRPGWTGLRMNTNESPYGPPEAVVERFLAGMREAAFNRYPDRDARPLLEALAQQVGHPAEGVWLANGSNEVFLHLFLAFGGNDRSVMVFEPTYSLHSLIPRITGSRVVTEERDEVFAVDVERALAAIERHGPDIVVLCSPNNPTGNPESRATVEAILDHAPGLVVVDEAYDEFAPVGTSARDLLSHSPNLVIVKTFSKAWSLAGARLGYLLAHPELVADLARVRLPYHLSTPTQLLGEAVLEHIGLMREPIENVAAERDRLIVGLQALGVKTYPSRANFVLFEVEEPGAVWGGLLERGILIRRYETSPRLERCLRVTAGLPTETDAFLTTIEEVLRDV
jgi:histidinol-phosphate aminotransferase